MSSFVWIVTESWIVATQWRHLCNKLLHYSNLVRRREVSWQ